MSIKMIITGGGTGGHIYPGLNIAFELKKRDSANGILFIGTKRGMESKLVPKEGFEFKAIKARGIQRKICLENIWAILIFLVSCLQAYKILRQFKPDLVIGTGGYVSGSVVLVASLMGITTFIHEQNVFPGITNRMLANRVKAVFLSFEESRRYFKGNSKIIFTGNPIGDKKVFLGEKREEVLKKFGLHSKKKTILVFGGSKGAATINRAVIESIKLVKAELLKNGWQVLMVSGNEDYYNCKKMAREIEMEGILAIEKYIYDMKMIYSVVNLAICRAGATTIAELCAFGLPSILIPYPWATHNHQEYNARILEKEGAAIVLLDKDLTKDRLAEKIIVLIKDEKKLEAMSSRSRGLGKTDANQVIVDLMLEYIPKNKLEKD